MPIAAKASAALVFAKFFERGLSMISAPIFTRIMDTSQYGVTSNFSAWQSILAIVITLNLASGVFNNGMLEFEEDRDSFICSLMLTSMVSTVFFFCLYLMFPQYTQGVLGLSNELILLMFLYFFLSPNYGYWANKQRYEFKYKALTIMTIGSSILSLVTSVIVVLILPDEWKPLGKVIGSEIGLLILAAFFSVYNGFKAKFKVKKKYIIYALKFNIPLIPHYLSMYVLSSSDRIMITNYCGTSKTAIYSVAYTVASIMLIFWSAIEASLVPWLYGELKADNIKNIRKSVNQLMTVFAVVCFVSACFSPEIIRILATEDYYEGIYIIPAVVASVFFTALFNIYMRVELYYKKTGVSTIATTISAVSNIVLNMIFIPRVGFIAAGYTTLFCYIVQTITHYIAVRTMKKNYIYDTKFLAVLSGIVILASTVVQILYQYMLIRYMVIGIIFIGCFVFRNSLKEMIRKMKKR